MKRSGPLKRSTPLKRKEVPCNTLNSTTDGSKSKLQPRKQKSQLGRSTGLKSSGFLKRGKPMKKKRRRNNKPEVRYAYAEQHQSCAVTWARAGQFGIILDPHHLVAGAGRKDDPRNLLTLSREAHDHYHFGGWIDENDKQREPLTAGHLMWCKKQADIENYDEQFIAELLGRKSLPKSWEPAIPPGWVFKERERNMR